MSLRKNIVFSYCSQIYVTVIGIVMLPIYIGYMGEEAYGLVGFFASLQATFQILDFGLSPTIARETARSSSSNGVALRQLLHFFEKIFLTIALFGACIVILFAQQIADHWLKFSHLSAAEVTLSLRLMGVIVGLRFISGLYRGVVTGFENIVWLSGFTSFVTTIRFVLVLPLFLLFGAAPATFFTYQVVVALIEAGGMIWKTYALLPRKSGALVNHPALAPTAGMFKFSATVAFTSSVWVLVTQVDKLALSKTLPLSQYAHFTLAIVVASGITIISGPLGSAVLPRMTRLAGEANEQGFLQLYKSASQLATIVCVSVAAVMTIFAHRVLVVWTGQAALADSAAGILSLYAIGNGILAVSALPYYLQFAKGDLKLHLIGNFVFLTLLVPAIIFSALTFGAIGTGIVWASVNALYFLFWLPIVHKRLAPGQHLTWLINDVTKPALVVVFLALGAKYLFPWNGSRLLDAVQLGLIGVICLLGGALTVTTFRRSVMNSTVHRYLKKYEH